MSGNQSPVGERSPVGARGTSPRAEGGVEDGLTGGAGGEVPSPAHLEAAGVCIEYRSSGRSRDSGGVLAVQDVNLVLSRTDFVCVVGRSGCGKTTFLNVIAGFLPITTGSLRLNGHDIPGPGPDRAMVFQQASLLPWRNVLDNVTYGLELGKTMRWTQERQRTRDLVDLVGLSGAEHQHPAQLSGGMQQRVNLARALAMLMNNAGQQFQTSIGVAGLIIFAVTGVVLTGVLRLIERRFAAWRPTHH